MSSLLERIQKELESELIAKATVQQKKTIDKSSNDEDLTDPKVSEESFTKNDNENESSKPTTSTNQENCVSLDDENESKVNTDDEAAIEKKYTKVLKKHFGYSKFRPYL